MRWSSTYVFPRPLTSLSSFFFAYCCRLPPSASRFDHLAKHFQTIQWDVVGRLDGLLCHLLAVDVEFDSLRRDADVELQEDEDWQKTLLPKHSCLLKTSWRPTLLQLSLARSTKNTGAFQKLCLAFIFIWTGMITPLKRMEIIKVCAAIRMAATSRNLP